MENKGLHEITMGTFKTGLVVVAAVAVLAQGCATGTGEVALDDPFVSVTFPHPLAS